MSRLGDVFKNKKAFIPFVTAGDPKLETTEKLVLAMAEAGADLVELGIPFSDPVAEGVVIQRADERALAAGTTTDKIFESVRRIRQKTDVPLALMTYINPIFAYGPGKFMKNCRDAGVDAVIVPDLPFEEKGEIKAFCGAYGVTLVSLIAPTSNERVAMIAREAEGFVYVVSSLGVTGVRSEIVTDLAAMIALVKAAKDIPCAVGFGISTPEQARKIAAVADGAIVGSAIVKIVEQYGEASVDPVRDYVREMKRAVAGEA
ncbi:tryptophan synthase, alpha chain [Sporobacter termitidis DSM 10068]|uniref:Tryptophan synthase alpha chain n=1 Tax=Sporobacter termitidis DSM 10068 TaxID=1123282 RepID=A0A1M5ZB86_9FIRM|nr:tryptophan synthase subunit alpha [Sporobacter termitidis]SHI21485.1 tryptophan synthase, alpha chain [Sporobacter termitidis DSM 10068]